MLERKRGSVNETMLRIATKVRLFSCSARTLKYAPVEMRRFVICVETLGRENPFEAAVKL